jgi:hypothetical protein
MRGTNTRCRCDVAAAGAGYKRSRLEDESTRRGRITARLVRQGDDERGFDDEFWSKMSGEERVSLLWDMVLEVRRIRGEAGEEPPLRRDVLRVIRSPRVGPSDGAG